MNSDAPPAMRMGTNRVTVDLSEYPDLVVICLGMRINSLAGIKTLLSFVWKVGVELRQKPEGLLHHDTFMFSIRQIGLRQYWENFESLENWTRSLPHKGWWQSFLRDSGGAGFWHEIYFIQGGMEGIYDGMTVPVGFGHFAATQAPRGPRFDARSRLQLGGESQIEVPVPEEKIYDLKTAQNCGPAPGT